MPSAVFKLRGILASLIVVMHGLAFAQPYYHDYVLLGKKAIDVDRLDSAAFYYELAFQRYVGLALDRVDYARVLKMTGAEERSVSQLLFAIDSLHLHEYHFLLHDSRFQTWRSPSLWQSFQHKADSILAVHLRDLNTSYRDELLRMHVTDQAIRKALGIVEYTELLPDSIIRKIWKAYAPVDSVHSDRLVELIEQYGFPDVDRVGIEANKSAWLVLLHSDLPIKDTYLPVLKASCDRGQTPMKYYAYVHDRRINQTGVTETKYGCSLRLEEDGVTWLRAQNGSCINLYREQVGLPPLDEFRDEGPCVEY